MRDSATISVGDHFENAANFKNLQTTKMRTKRSATNACFHSEEKHWYCHVHCTHGDSQSVNWRVAGKCYACVLWSVVERRVAGQCYAGVLWSAAASRGWLASVVERRGRIDGGWLLYAPKSHMQIN